MNKRIIVNGNKCIIIPVVNWWSTNIKGTLKQMNDKTNKVLAPLVMESP